MKQGPRSTDAFWQIRRRSPLLVMLDAYPGGRTDERVGFGEGEALTALLESLGLDAAGWGDEPVDYPRRWTSRRTSRIPNPGPGT